VPVWHAWEEDLIHSISVPSSGAGSRQALRERAYAAAAVQQDGRPAGVLLVGHLDRPYCLYSVGHVSSLIS
jgi:nitrous oxide reductase